MDDLFSRSVAEIDKECARLGHQLGWRFLTTPRKTFTSDAEVAFLSQHPGGDVDDPKYPRASCEFGSAYVHEAWFRLHKAPLRDGKGEALLQRDCQGNGVSG